MGDIISTPFRFRALLEITAPVFGTIPSQTLTIGDEYSYTIPITGVYTSITVDTAFSAVRQMSEELNVPLGGHNRSIVVVGDEIWTIDNVDENIYIYDLDGVYLDFVNLGYEVDASFATEDRVYLVERDTNALRAYDYDENRVSSDDNTSALDNVDWAGGTYDGTHVVLLDNDNNRLRFFNTSFQEQTMQIDLPNKNWQSVVALPTGYMTFNADDDIMTFYDRDGDLVSDNNFTVSGDWFGASSIFSNVPYNSDRIYMVNLLTGVVRVYSVYTGALPNGLILSDNVVSGTPTVEDTFSVMFTATNSAGSDTVTIDYTVQTTLATAPVFSPATQPAVSASVGDTFSLDLNAIGNPTPTYSATNLPSGVSINSTTGVISGEFDTVQTRTTTVTATNSEGMDTVTIDFTIQAELTVPVFSPATQPAVSASVGDAFSLDLDATGNPTPTYSENNLPPGLSIDTTTGVISGTFTGAETSTTTVTATNSEGADTVTIEFTIQALTVPVFSPATQPAVSMRVGDTFSLDLDATGNPAPTYSATNLPSGVSINSTTGVISGEFDTVQTRTTTVTATNSEGMDTVTIDFTIQAELTVPVFSPATQPAVSASVGDAFSLDLDATGNPTPTYSENNLPPGLSIDTTTGVISGTFTGAETSTTTVTATNSEGADTVTIEFTIQALTVPVFSPATQPAVSMRVGDTFSLDLDATGNPAPTYSATNLPSGVSINSTTGVISGEFDTVQTRTTTVTATNSEGMDTVTIDFTIQAALTVPVFSPATQPAVSAIVGDAFSLDLDATGNPTPTYSENNLPPGLSIDTITGVISGTFTGAETSTTTVTATNSEGTDTVTIEFTIQALTVPVFGTIPPQTLTIGEEYSYTIPITGVYTSVTVDTAFSAMRQTSEELDIPSQGNNRSIVIVDDNIWSIDNFLELVFIYNLNGSYQDFINLGYEVHASFATEDRVYLVERDTNALRAYDYDENRVSSDDNTSALDNVDWAGGTYDGTHVVLLDNDNNRLRFFNTSFQEQTMQIDLPNKNWQSVVALPTGYMTFNADDDIMTFYDRDGDLVSDNNFTVSGDWFGASSIFGNVPYNSDRIYMVNRTSGIVRVYSVYTGTLPNGLILTDNVISGTPTVEDTFSVMFTATNSVGSDTVTIEFTVQAALEVPVFSPATQPAVSANVGDTFSLNLNATGNPTPTYSASNLPPGLSINTTTGVISGEFTNAETSTTTVTATNSEGTDTVTIDFTIQAFTVPVFSPATQPAVSANVGDTFSLDLNATGNPTPTYSATNLPGGLSINSTTGVISGTFTTGQTRTTTVTATNSEGTDTVSIAFTVVGTAPVFGAILGQSLTVGTDYNYTLPINRGGLITTISEQLTLNIELITGDDIDLGVGNWTGGAATSTRLYFVDTAPDFVRAYDHSGNRQSGDDIDLGDGTWTGGIATSTRLYFIDSSPDFVRAYDHSGNRQSGDDIDLGNGAWNGGAATSTRLYFVDNTFDFVRAYDHSGNRQSGDDIDLGNGIWKGLIATETRLYVIRDIGSTGVLIAYDYSGNRHADDDVSLVEDYDGGTNTSFMSDTINDRIWLIDDGNNIAHPYTLLGSGLPDGIFYSNGVVSGTPTVEDTFSVMFTATNSVGSDTVTIDYTVQAALGVPVFSPATQPAVSANVGDTFSLDLNATGNPTPTYSATNLPSGVSINSTTGVISGEFDTVQTRTTTVTATNSEGMDTVTIEFTIQAALTLSIPVFSPATQPAVSASVGDTFSLDLDATGNPTPTYSASNLPPGLSINTTTGVISGEFTNAETSTTTVTATNSEGMDTVTIEFTIQAALTLSIPVFSPATQPAVSASVGDTFSLDLDATGNPTPTYSASNLPPGLEIDTITGVISGTFTGAETSTTTVTATNSEGTDTVTIDFTIQAFTVPVFSPATQPAVSANVGDTFSLDLNATGNPTPTYSATNLPGGLSINSTTGVISGTFTTGQTRTTTVTATNSEGTDTVTIAFTIQAALTLSIPVFSPATQPAVSASVGDTFSLDLDATGNPTPTYSASNLPPGLEIDTITGVISGTFTGAETSTTTVTATNSEGTDTVTIDFTIQAFTVPVFSPATQPAVSANVGDTFSLDLNATGNPTPTYSATNLPGGLSINSTTGVISGTFTTGQTRTTTVTATNSEGTDTVTIAFTIQAALTLSIPVFSPATQPAVSASVGDTFSLDLDATGNPTPTYSASNLPPGLSINTTTGVISGEFTNAETSTTTVTATNSEGTDTVTIAFTIQAVLTAPVWSNIPQQLLPQDTEYSLDLNTFVSGNPTPGITEIGASTFSRDSAHDQTYGQDGSAWDTLFATNTEFYAVRRSSGSSSAFYMPIGGNYVIGSTISLSTIIGGTNLFGAGFATENYIYFVQFTSNTVYTARAFDFERNRQSDADFPINASDISGVSTIRLVGAFYEHSIACFYDSTNQQIHQYDNTGLYVDSVVLAGATRLYSAFFIDGNSFYLVDEDGTVNAWNFFGSRLPQLDFNAAVLNNPNIAGATFFNNRAYVLDRGNIDAFMPEDASALPPGLSFNNGVISGTPTTSGAYNVRLSASNSEGSANRGIVFVVS